MLLINWQLTLVALLIVPILLIATGMVQRISTPAFTKLQEELGALSGFQEETISGHKVIISNRRHGWAEDKSDVLAGGVYDVAPKPSSPPSSNIPSPLRDAVDHGRGTGGGIVYVP
jgi:ABC-type multidrug transport system fused ATPase/permease subunit